LVIAQPVRPSYVPGLPPPALSLAPANPLKRIRPNAPGPNDVRVFAVSQEADGAKYHLRGNASVETSDMLLQADEIDYDRDTGDAEARGHVRFEHYVNGEKLNASHVTYNVDDETGQFFDVSGTSPAKIEARPGVLTTSNPFYFQGKWAERQKDRYILYDGFVTDCKMPNPWWILKGPKFDIIPDDRAKGYRSVYWLRKVPLLYMPIMYRPLGKNPRHSGFLTPNVGNSTTRGKMIGIGYFWAINRSYDLTYTGQYFSIRGLAHQVTFRGKLNEKTDFGAVIYGVNDRGIKIGNTLVKEGGYIASFGGRTDLGHGWTARGEFEYLSSFAFRQNFTESFHEAIFAESHSIGDLTKHWSSFGVNIAADREEVFQFENPTDKVTTRKLPEVEFLSRERLVNTRVLPIWVSLESSAGLYYREEPLFTTTDFMRRIDVEPRVTTAFHFKGFTLVPSFSARATDYGESFVDNRVVGANIVRTSREVRADLVFPSLARIYQAPKWMHAQKLKHVIEPRVTFRDVAGITDFNKIVRIDTTDLLTNTRELEISLTNRLYKKNSDGKVEEVFSWQLAQVRYFDPTFGGAVIPGQRNVILSSSDLTGFAFIDGYRNYSPVISAIRYYYKVNMEWRADYDPLRGHIVNSSYTADWRMAQYFFSVGHSQVRDSPVLSPSQNQFRATVGVGNENKRGWNAGFSAYYDYRKAILTFATTQVTYNTDCCGFSVQFRRFDLGFRNENQYRIAFSIANIGSFGTLKHQEQIF
jgi:LPS-assembly protein